MGKRKDKEGKSIFKAKVAGILNIGEESFDREMLETQSRGSTLNQNIQETIRVHENNGNLLTDLLDSREDEDEDEDENEDEADAEDEQGIEQEEDVEEDVEEDDAQEDEPPSKRQRKQVSAQEYQVARETTELFKSNIFKLQIEELLKEVKLKESHITRIEKVLHRLYELIQQIPETGDLSLDEAQNIINKKIAIPFPDPRPTKLNYKLSYTPPEDYSLVGSFGLKTGIHQHNGMSIDLALTMPRELLTPKDYLNYRALYKRAFYMAYLADRLIPLAKGHSLPIKITYKYLNDDILCPILSISSIQTDNDHDLTFFKTKFSINIIIGFPNGFFDAKKLLPDKNCIRVQSESELLPPTPIYNSSLLSMTAYDYYLKYLYTTKKATEAFRDACVLGRLWLQQRGLGSSINAGGFGHFEFAILMSALLAGGGENGNRILLHGFSSYQLFKATIKYIASVDLASGYLSFSSLIGENVVSKYNKNAGLNVPTIFDKNVKLNILWKMTKFSYEVLQKHASETLILLNDAVIDRFDSILLQRSDFDLMRYDMVFNLVVPYEMFDSFGPLEKISFITFDNYLKHKIYFVLKKALIDRVSLINIKIRNPICSYPLSKRKPSKVSNNIIIGLQLNPDECEKLVTRGPENTDDQAAEEFKDFWGSLSSLRRFKGGVVQHCVVWSNEGESVIVQIMKYALSHHLHKSVAENLIFEASGLKEKLPLPIIFSGHSQLVNSLSSFTNLRSSFEDLSKVLVNLDLPLKVKNLLPASSSLRYTSLLQPVPFAISNPDFWNDCILQFETLTRWPDELVALEKTKTAFLLKIYEILKKETLYESFMSKDDSIPFNNDITLLNILTPDGYGFRIRVLTERDEILYLRAVDNSGKQKPLLQDIYLKFYLVYLGAVKHTRTVSMLAVHFQFYAGTVRLFKRWLDSQLLLHHFTEELVELIALKPFVDPAPYSVPHSIENGFLQILSFLSSWNWKEDPLILDLSKSSFTNEEDDIAVKLSDKLTILSFQIIKLNFEKIRRTDLSGIKTQFFVGSKDDPSGILWSLNLSLPIASRLTGLSRAALQMIKTEGLDKDKVETVFTPVLKDYDFVMNLKAANLTISSGVLPPNSFKNLIEAPTSFPDDLASKYDLIQGFVKDLELKFGNVILFTTRKFTGLSGDNKSVICGLFDPSALTRKKFRVGMGTNIMPAEGHKDEVVVNQQAIFDEILMLGGDMIDSIKHNR